MVINSKQRREQGRLYNKFYDPENGFFNQQFWSDWIDRRDGFRNANHDRTLKSVKVMKKGHWGRNITHNNRKIDKMLIIRKLRRTKKH